MLFDSQPILHNKNNKSNITSKILVKTPKNDNFIIIDDELCNLILTNSIIRFMTLVHIPVNKNTHFVFNSRGMCV